MHNQLAHESSPYLQQHAANPVDWYPWGPEALARARAENRPILLSIGYSACHWCHVMAEECFEDAQVAAVMNRLFVNIKVDREERPDLDQVYQLAHQMLARRPGGWPLTVFLLPDGMPFFAGTYFPRTARGGLPGFTDLCERIAAIYRQRSDDIARQSASLREAFAALEPTPQPQQSELGDTPIVAAVAVLKERFDPDHGGFGAAPKFPHATDIELCLRWHAASGDGDALNMALVTLTGMAEGGLLDQLGGGFYRYSTDAQWTIPHFEKMLCDNAQLLGLYADAWAITRDPLYARVADATAGWMLREMQADHGGFHASLDADSEHQEGGFYVWTPDEVRGLLDAEEYAVAAPHYGLDDAPNFEDRHWHLRIVRPLPAIARHLGRAEADCRMLLDRARAKLLAARQQRVRPGKDDKLLTSWNALAVAGLARAGRVLGRPDWVDAALRAFDFLRTAAWKQRRLYATCKDGRARLNAYLDDYAFLLAAALELVQARFEAGVLAFASELAQVLLERFEDRSAGGFWFTSHDHEALIHRSKPAHDNATPSGNAIAALSLLRLSLLTNDGRCRSAAERTIDLFQAQLREQPSGCASLLMALQERLEPSRTVVLRGESGSVEAWHGSLARSYRPGTLILGLGDVAEGSLPAPLQRPLPDADGACAWVCTGTTCLAPIASLEKLLPVLDSRAPVAASGSQKG